VSRARVALAVAALVLLAAAGDALACACCTNYGQRNVQVAQLDSGRLAEIDQLRFTDTASSSSASAVRTTSTGSTRRQTATR